MCIRREFVQRAGRHLLRLLTRVRVPDSLPDSQRGRIAAITLGSDPSNEDSSSSRAAKVLWLLRLTGEGTGLRNLEYAFDSHGGHQFSVRRPTGQGTALRRPESRFESARIDHVLRWCQTGMKRIVYPYHAGSNPVQRARVHVSQPQKGTGMNFAALAKFGPVPFCSRRARVLWMSSNRSGNRTFTPITRVRTSSSTPGFGS